MNGKKISDLVIFFYHNIKAQGGPLNTNNEVIQLLGHIYFCLKELKNNYPSDYETIQSTLPEDLIQIYYPMGKKIFPKDAKREERLQFFTDFYKEYKKDYKKKDAITTSDDVIIYVYNWDESSPKYYKISKEYFDKQHKIKKYPYNKISSKDKVIDDTFVIVNYKSYKNLNLSDWIRFLKNFNHTEESFVELESRISFEMIRTKKRRIYIINSENVLKTDEIERKIKSQRSRERIAELNKSFYYRNRDIINLIIGLLIIIGVLLFLFSS